MEYVIRRHLYFVDDVTFRCSVKICLTINSMLVIENGNSSRCGVVMVTTIRIARGGNNDLLQSQTCIRFPI